jgi:HEAT repeat protein
MDFLSFLLGLLVGTGSGVGGTIAYQQYRRIQSGTKEGEEHEVRLSWQQEQRPEMAYSSNRRRYYEELAFFLERQHLAGKLFPLSQVMIEPHLLVDIDHLLALEEQMNENFLGPTRVIPRIHELPEVYAHYNLENISLEELNSSERHIAILGIPGLGKSTTLAIIGLLALNKVDFATTRELMDEAIEAEFEGLSEEDLQRRRRDFERAQENAMEHLREARHLRDDIESVLGEMKPINELFPVYVHVRDIEIDLNIYGLQVDPAEPVINAFETYVSDLTWKLTAETIYRNLDEGDSIVLIDGFDELSSHEQSRIYPWLQSFMQEYGHNRIVITGPVSGYDPLVELGFTPTFLQPWSPYEIQSYIEKWATVWQQLSQDQKGDTETPIELDEATLDNLFQDTAFRNPVELTLKTWAGLADDTVEEQRRAWFDYFVRSQSPELEQTPLILREIATVMLDRGTILKREQVAEIASTHLTITEENEEGELIEKPLTNIDKFVDNLVESDLMVSRATHTVDFHHPLVTAYLAGERLIHDMSHRLGDVAKLPNWHHAIGFAAAGIDITRAVVEKLQTPPDLVYSNLFSLVRWIPDAPLDSKWRGEILKRLSAAWLATSQFPSLREHAVAGLVASRDPDLIHIFRRGIRNANPDIRRLACIGLGAVGDPSAIKDLRPMLVDDQPGVQLAAGHALGAIGTEEALHIMVEALLEGEEDLQRAVAEAMASIPGEGHNILRDAINHERIPVRRAAVFGLARVPASWALVEIYRTMLEDKEWYVRSAAQLAFAETRDPTQMGLRAYPLPLELPWLEKIAKRLGLEVQENEAAFQLMIRLLREAPPPFRVRAAHTLGKLGYTPAIRALYGALGDEEEQVRRMAYRALAELQRQMMTQLPNIA